MAKKAHLQNNYFSMKKNILQKILRHYFDTRDPFILLINVGSNWQWVISKSTEDHFYPEALVNFREKKLSNLTCIWNFEPRNFFFFWGGGEEEIAKFFSKTLESRMSKGKKVFFAYFVLQCFQNHFPLLSGCSSLKNANDLSFNP